MSSQVAKTDSRASDSLGTAPQMNLTLSYVNHNLFHSKKVKNLVDLIADRMEHECGIERGRVLNYKTATSVPHKYGFFLLHDGKEVLCSAYVEFLSVICRWTPPQHRHKGYAKMILLEIERLWRGTTTPAIPLSVASYPRMFPLNEAIGWVMCDATNPVDDERLWCPPDVKDLLDIFAEYETTKKRTPTFDTTQRQFRDEWFKFYTATARPHDFKLKVKV